MFGLYTCSAQTSVVFLALGAFTASSSTSVTYPLPPTTAPNGVKIRIPNWTSTTDHLPTLATLFGSTSERLGVTRV